MPDYEDFTERPLGIKRKYSFSYGRNNFKRHLTVLVAVSPAILDLGKSGYTNDLLIKTIIEIKFTN